MSPQSPRKICRSPHCHKKTRQTYCTQCQDKGLGKKKYGFDSKQDEWYNLPIWKGNANLPLGQRGGLRERQLLEQPYCTMCKEEDGVINDVTGKGEGVVDHIKRFRDPNLSEQEQWQLFVDTDNHDTKCKMHHKQKSAKESNG